MTQTKHYLVCELEVGGIVRILGNRHQQLPLGVQRSYMHVRWFEVRGGRKVFGTESVCTVSTHSSDF